MTNLLASLTGVNFDKTVIGPRGDTCQHILSIDVLKGDDDYCTTNTLHISDQELTTKKESIKTPNRLRGMGGVVITFWSEEEYTWSRQLLFHKGCIYESDTMLEDGIGYEGINSNNQLEFNL